MARPPTVTGELLRRRNVAALLRHLHLRGATTRAHLTTTMGLNRSTIGALTAELIAAGLVSEEPGVAGPGVLRGRPSHRVVPQSERVWVLAIDLAVHQVEVARVGLGGVLLDRQVVLLKPRDYGHHALDDVVELVRRLCRQLSLRRTDDSRCVGVGAAVCGVVARESGLVRFAPNLGWTDVPFGAAVSAALGADVVVGNDADLGVLAEHLRGSAVGASHVVYLAGEVGVGGGVLVDGRLVSGSGGYAGEVGHLVLDPDGAPCRCGSVGCWETVVGADALLAAAGRAPGGGIRAVQSVIAAAEGGDTVAAAALDTVARWVGTGLAAVVNMLDPEVVVLGGVFGQVLTVREDAIHTALAARSLSAPRAQVRLVQPGLGAASPLVGAAELAFARLLDDPLDALAALVQAALAPVPAQPTDELHSRRAGST